ncbi:MAG TPA: TonB-dependent receptor [Flavisolibacter sp.]|nr:TonB-dependent receptor [Flavisolibacter sp.]
MKLKIALLLCALFMLQSFSAHLWAQSLTVTGRVTSRVTNEPLPGATVTIKGTNQATVTDENGQFTITVPRQGSTLSVSYAGMDVQEMTVNQAGPMNISLTSTASALNEVVVVGYGTQRRSAVTGAISSVKAGDVDNQPIMRIEQMLQGRASGLTIAASSGQPGSGSTLRVRGTTSINNSDPLYVVDGVPVDIGGIDYLNPNDIESIEVLKDASSAAIYGARAASGVILVTTKKGKAGTMRVNYNGYYGTQAPAKRLKLLNATEYAVLRNEQSVADGGGIVFPNIANLGIGTDWQKIIFNTDARIQDHQVSLSGGSERSNFYTSFSLFDQEGIVASDISNYKRFTARLNSNHKLTNWLSFGNNIGYSHIKALGIGNTNSEYGGVLSSAINLDPLTQAVITDAVIAGSAPYAPNSDNSNGAGTIRDAHGNPYGISQYVGQEMANPLAFIQTRLGNHGWSDNLVGNAFLELEPIKGLKIRSNVGAKYAFWGAESFTPLFYLNASTIGKNNSFYRENNRAINYTWENTASYSRKFGAHNVSALIGTGAYVNNYLSRNGGVTYRNLPVSSYDEASSMNFPVTPENTVGWGSESTPHKVSSIYGRVTYDYNEKYLFTGIIRRDGSSRFGSNNKYGYFPSGSIGWVASREDFWPSNRVVTFLKVRGSYGVTGNDNIGDFRYVSTIGGGRNYTFGNDSYVIGYSPNAPSNPDLRWEETSQTDIGFDATIFKNFSLTFDWYKKKTTGMLLAVQLPGYVGAAGNPIGNVADMENTGYELELGYGRNFNGLSLQVNANVSHLKNRVTYLGADKKFLDGGANLQSSQYPISRTAVGHAIGSFYGFQTLGIFQNAAEVNSYVNKTGQLIQPNARPGDFKWADLNGDGVINADDRTFIGDPTPDWSYGFNINAAYKGIDLVVFGQGAGGNQIFNGLRRLDIANANWTTKALSRWTGEGTSNTHPRLTSTDPNRNYSNPSVFHLENGDYFRIKMLQLGYSLPRSITDKAHFQKVRVYVSANNLFTFTEYTGFDPEIGGSSYGIDRGFYPQARSFTAGVNLTF